MEETAAVPGPDSGGWQPSHAVEQPLRYFTQGGLLLQTTCVSDRRILSLRHEFSESKKRSPFRTISLLIHLFWIWAEVRVARKADWFGLYHLLSLTGAVS